MKYATALLLSLMASGFLFAQESEVFFTESQSLSPDGQTIYFSYEGDIWSVGTEGGLATRLTALDGTESHVRVAPDGKWLAFTSTQFGSPDVYIMPLDGGPIQQLTYHQAADMVSSWSWDSQSIYFTSSRENRMSTYKVGIKGGTPQRLFGHYFNTIHNLVQHPGNGAFYFNESWESSNFEHRKRYKGAYNPNIKSYNPKTGKYKEWTTYEGKDMMPVFDQKGNLYFLSDNYNGEYNLYTFKDGEKTRLTNYYSSARFPSVSANGQKIVFTKDYQLHVYDTQSGETTKVPVRAVRNNTLNKSQDFNVAGNITAFDISDDKEKLAFVSRGELFVSDSKGKFVRQLPTRPDGRVMEVYWLKDNKTLIFNQTVDGYQNWFTLMANGQEEEQQLTSDARNNRSIAFNSDKSEAVYLSGRDEVRLLDLESFESKVIVKDELWGFYNDLPTFSPDDRYILYTAYRDFEKDIFVFDTKEEKTMNLTQTAVTETSPVWSPDGKYIYFTTNRTEPNYPYGLQNADIYRMPLEAFDQPFRSDKWEEMFEEEEEEEGEKGEKDEEGEEGEKGEDEEEDKIEVVIDTEGLMERIERVGPSFGSQQAPYVVQKKEKTIVLYMSNHDEGDSRLWTTVSEPFEKSKTEKFKGLPDAFVSIEEADGKYFGLAGGDLYTMDIDGPKAEKIEISYTFRRQLKEEFEQMFYETWANMEENFYNETFHGINWEAVRDQYAAFLPHVQSRANLRRMLNDMLGELNTSHFGFYSNGKEEQVFYKTNTLATGIVFSDDNPYQVERIVTESPAARKGKDIKPGDRLVAVNGERIEVNKNREFYFNRPSSDEEVVLTFIRNNQEHDVKLHPTTYSYIRNLLYDEWMDANQKQVDEKGDRRIAYVHMKNMGGYELNRFLTEMVSEGTQREGIILDLRYNTGGNVHDKVLQFLSQRPYLKWKYREGTATIQSNFGPAVKPVVLLINEQSLSDAEMTAAGFKELGLGTIIGTETYRWIIFTTGKGLVDGSFYRLPSWGCYTLDGDNLEQTGVAPDIFVRNTFKHRVDGEDPQLDKAIEEVLSALKK